MIQRIQTFYASITPEDLKALNDAIEHKWDTELSGDPSDDSKREYKPQKGYVYLLRSISGYYKIGKAKNPERRMKTFGVQLPFEVEFEHVIRCDDMNAYEKELHRRHASKRINGEWFDLSPEDVADIKAIGGVS
jgi:predicted GIY-YIG superfamily endonuclease